MMTGLTQDAFQEGCPGKPQQLKGGLAPRCGLQDHQRYPGLPPHHPSHAGRFSGGAEWVPAREGVHRCSLCPQGHAAEEEGAWPRHSYRLHRPRQSFRLCHIIKTR